MSKLGNDVERELEAHILDDLALSPGKMRSRGELEKAIPDDLRRRCGALRKAIDVVDGRKLKVFRDKIDLRARLEWLRRRGLIVMEGTGRNARYLLASRARSTTP